MKIPVIALKDHYYAGRMRRKGSVYSVARRDHARQLATVHLVARLLDKPAPIPHLDLLLSESVPWIETPAVAPEPEPEAEPEQKPEPEFEAELEPEPEPEPESEPPAVETPAEPEPKKRTRKRRRYRRRDLEAED